MVYSQQRNIFVKRDVKLTEPPDAEPHVRWCERSAAKAVSYSIQGDWSVNLDDVDDDDDIDVYTTESLVDFSAWSNGEEMKCQLRDGADGNKYVVGFFGNKICNEKLQAEFPGGIVLGQSTREDVKKAYGEDSYDVYRGFGGNSLGYWKEFGVGVSFGFDQDGRLTGFALENDPQQYN